ncbi:MFS transporter [Antrihabitans stalactiti]|uniref:MFS transporter n=1 Tax=Antrihabitans stalactiti TaxID=2584121 RepID=UPI0030B810F4
MTSADGFDRKLFAPLISGAVLNPVNSTIISVALVPIGVAFGQPASSTAWLISSLYLATAVGQPVVGRLIDVYGPRRLFLPATAMVGLAGVIGTVAPNLWVLVVARVVLGFGTCAGYPAAMRLIRDESDRTGKDSPALVLTVLSISTQTIAVIGPSLGGLLIEVGGWRATFAINIPLAVFAFVLAARRFPKSTPPVGEKRSLDLDLVGMATFAGALVALLLFLMDPRVEDWYLVVAALVLAAAFTARELSCAHPFIDLRILGSNRPLLITYGRALLAYVVSYSFLYGYTQWLEHGRGLSASQTGLATLPLFLTGILVSFATGRRKGVRGKLVVAAVAQIAGCTLLLALHSSSPVWLLLVVALAFGIPQGLGSLALQNSVYHQANPADIGASAGLLRTSSYLGAIISAAAQGAFYGEAATTVGMHNLAFLLIGVGVVFLLITVFDRSLTKIDTRPEMETTRA